MEEEEPRTKPEEQDMEEPKKKKDRVEMVGTRSNHNTPKIQTHTLTRTK